MMRVLAAVLFIVSVSLPGTVAARSLEDLRAEGSLRASIEVETSAPYFRHAPLILSVQVETSLAFTRGTRVMDLRVPGALVRPVSSFALNSSEQRDAETWISQRWRFRLYPRDLGRLALPAARVDVSVRDASGESFSGILEVSHPALDIIAPPGSDGTDYRIAAPKLEVRESWEDRLDAYEPGDAITRRRRFVAGDTPGMLLPPSEEPAIEGLSLYSAPAVVRDESNRGRLQGIREETLVITMEAPGDYQIPGRTLRWFNTDTRRVEELRLPGYAFSVGAPVLADANTKAAPGKRWGALLIGALLLLAGGLAFRWREALVALAGVPAARLEPLRRRVAYTRSLRRGDAHAALEHLRRALPRNRASLREACAGDARARESLRALLATAYAPPRERDAGGVQREPRLPSRAGAHLWRCVAGRATAPPRASSGALRLNPAPSRHGSGG
jgi:hypothetical protein